MNPLIIFLLKGLRKIYVKVFANQPIALPPSDQNPDSVSRTIYHYLSADQPCMIARFGSTEMLCLCNYIGITQQKYRVFDFIKGTTFLWMWDPKIINQMQNWSGFFPAKAEKMEQFCEMMIRDIPEIDVMGSWLKEERQFEKELAMAQKVSFLLLDPFWAETPWTKALEGKKVLVVHPFANTIEKQYKKRKLVLENNPLPEFELKTIKAVQSIAGTKTPFKDWFEALEFMKTEIDKTDYDICLIGCGAYGFPLAAHVKRMGKKGFQLGGSLQLLFGIKGKRWSKEYNNEYDYSTIQNEHWVKPGFNETPEGSQKVEGACYW